MIGTQGSPYLDAGRWQVFAGYRYQMSGRHFVGKEEQKEREHERSTVRNWVHLFDLAGTYAVNKRINLTFSLPLIFSERSQALRNAQRVVFDRFSTQASGIGDISVTARTWVFDPEANPDRNVTVGFGMKFPTGSTDVSDEFTSANGTKDTRLVDTSIMPGDGGTGFVVEAQGFTRVWKTTLSATGLYLFNPRDTITCGITCQGTTVNGKSLRSVPDQYLLRFGAGFPLWPEKGIAGTFAWRIEGSPSTDLIGGSEGFRRPGYAISLEPGLAWGIGSNVFTLSAPLPISRNRVRSVPDIRNGGHGDAAFADYVILAGWAYRF